MAVAAALNSSGVCPVGAEHRSAAPGGEISRLTMPQLSVAAAVDEGAWGPRVPARERLRAGSGGKPGGRGLQLVFVDLAGEALDALEDFIWLTS